MARHIHIYLPRKIPRLLMAPVRDEEPRSEYEELTDELLAFLMKKARETRDDAQPGHPFYGNQYTDIPLGPKPTSTKATVTKHAVHELLSSGHPWSIDELASITGHQNKTTLQSWMSMFKSEKTAGSKGKLDIVKLPGGMYQVVKPNGQPATAGPALPEGWNEGIKEESAQPAEPIPPPAVEPPKGKVSDPVIVPSSPISKADANASYDAEMQSANDALKHFGPIVDDVAPASFEMVAKAWKQKKAKAMAQWAANVHGKAFEPKPVEVFPEDLQLMKDLAVATDKANQDAALAKWKSATIESKTGAKKLSSPSPAPTSKPPEQPPAPPKAAEAPSPPAAPLKAPEALVPDGWAGVEHSDFEVDPNHPTKPSKFAGEMDKLHTQLFANHQDKVKNKMTIQQHLTDRLKASPHFQSMQEQYSKKNGSLQYGGSLPARLISEWATSSGDHHAISVSAQLAVRDAFNMKPETVETSAFHYLQSASEEQTYKDAAANLGIDTSSPQKLEGFKQGMRDFALAQYHATQDHFKAQGIKELHLVRGMKFGAGTADAKKVNLKLQPASSFSTNYSTVVGFAGGHSLFMVKVPASQVLSSFVTGYGCTHEHEVVVLNHENLTAVQVGKSKAGGGMSQASAAIKEGLAKQGTPKAPGAKKPKKGTVAPEFKGKELPKPPTGVSKSWGAKLYQSAMKDPAEFAKLQSELASTNKNLPNTKNYAKTLAEAHAPQLKAHEEAVAAWHAKQLGAQAFPPSSLPKMSEKNAKVFVGLTQKFPQAWAPDLAKIASHSFYNSSVEELLEEGDSPESVLEFLEEMKGMYK